MGFQRGDQRLTIKDQTYGLRLTMGALAEITSRLSASGPQELSLRLRSMSVAEGRVLLACVMRPCLPLGADVTGLAASFSDEDIAQAMPQMCKLFEEAFRHDG